MKIYRNINGDSGVAKYEYGSDLIKVRFKRGGTYEYRASVIGHRHLDEMKKFADNGRGLNTYINENPKVRTGYSPK